ncbi:MAG: nucleotidyltransferase domain-containing protein, partial [Deltaproteobacteria bacterium]|nr:nucleotidyltransferase domain-containing protein [Deltaproteobacteria bacterium]
REVILFGSRAKGNYREGSDIDLAVKGQGITSGLLAQIDEEYDALDLPWKLDVLDYAKIHDAAVKAHIDRVGIAVLQR